MKYDVDHSTPYFQGIFQNVSDDDMTGGVKSLQALTTYHKKNHYLLNTGAVGYEPPSWSDFDNVFPEEAPVHPMTHIEWAAILKSKRMKGDVLEFGVACGGTIRDFAFINPKKRMHGFDHFEGLEQTQQFIPEYAGWHEGAFALDGPEYNQSYDDVIDDLSQFDNISIIVEDVHELTEPKDYEIGKICAVHIDVDIYEPTVSSLNFVDQCEWNKIYMRFDDWHGHEPDYDQHERLACREWLDRNNYKHELLRNGLHGEMIVTR